MTSNDKNDDQTMDLLRDALGYTDSADEETVDMIMTGFDIVGLDAVTAEILFDSAVTSAGVPVRDSDDGVRLLTASGGGLDFELEVRETSSQLVGRVTPHLDAEILLDQLGNEQSSEIDAAGMFEFELGKGPFRLRLTQRDGTVVATDWIQ